MTTDLKPEIKTSRKALGRGLAALIPDAEDDVIYPSANINTVRTEEKNKAFFYCPVEKLVPSSQQPRKKINDEALNELANSIKENGVIQAVIVRRRGDLYEIVAGERRWRAAKLAGLTSIPVVVKEMSDKITLQTAIVENIQRSDLNSIEEARAYKQLIDEYSMTQDDVSKKVGKDRTSISNYLRLLKLPIFVQDEVQGGRLSMGHAKALCGLEAEEALKSATAEVIKKDLSVRKTERLVERLKGAATKTDDKPKKDGHLFDSIEDNLREKFKTKVYVKGKYEKGAFVVEYFNKDDFERILEILLK
ncbi:MAG: ParB/RepB/Spo0J family partition protein [Pseudomonadota bacterium]